MVYSVAIQYKTPSGEIKTTGTKSTRANYVSSELQKRGMTILSVKSQGAGRNVPRQKANIEEGIQASTQEGQRITYYKAPPKEPIPPSIPTYTGGFLGRLMAVSGERIRTAHETGQDITPHPPLVPRFPQSRGEEIYLKYGQGARYLPTGTTLSNIEKQQSQLYETRLGIQSDQQYQVSMEPGTHRIVSGKDVRGELLQSEQQLSQYQKAQTQLSEYRSRGYIVTETDKGYSISVPESVALKEWETSLYEGMSPERKWLSKATATFLGGFANPEYIYRTVGTGEYDKASDIITRWQYGTDRSLKSGRFWEVPLQIPAVTNIILPYAGGMAIGGGLTYLGSKAAVHTALTGSKALTAFKAGQLAVGGTVVTLAGLDIHKTYEEKGAEAAWFKGAQLATQLVSGYSGYTAARGIRYKGATIGEWGAHRQYQSTVSKLMARSVDKFGGETVYATHRPWTFTTDPKTGFPTARYGEPQTIGFKAISPQQGVAALRFEQLGFDITRAYQGTSTLGFAQKQLSNIRQIFSSKIQTLKGKSFLQRFFPRQVKSYEGEIFGSASLGKARGQFHDIDIMFPGRKYAAALRTTEYVGGKGLADIKVLQKPGDIVTLFGGVKKAPYTISELKWMQLSEMAMRRTHSSFLLAKAGRSKDIMRSVDDWLDVYSVSGKPIVHKQLFLDYMEAAMQYEKAPLIMGEATSMSMYETPSFTESWAGFKNVLVKKFMPGLPAKEVSTIMGTPYPGGQPLLHVSSIPPSPSLSFVFSPFTGAIVSSFFSPRSDSPSYTSISRSISSTPSTSISRSISYIPSSVSSRISKSVSPSIPSYISPSISRSLSPSISKSASSPLSSISKSISSSSSSISRSVSPSSVSPSIISPGFGGFFPLLPQVQMKRGGWGGFSWPRGTGYRTRTHKVPTMAQFLKGGMF